MDCRLRRAATRAVIGALGIAALAGAVPARAGGRPLATERVIVTLHNDGASSRVAAAVRSHRGRLLRALPLVHGFAAEVPVSYVPLLRQDPAVRSVTVDESLQLMAVNPDLGYDTATDFGGLQNIARVINADDSWAAGYGGKGIDVALLDSGVSPVTGLTSGNVVNGPDLSFESQAPELARLDTFGHGTHMASIIAGRDVAQASPSGYVADSSRFNGIAPDARIVSVKVADHSGATDVSQVIAGIDWIVEHAKDPGLNIRVLNLSFGTDSTQLARLDPLCYAVEQAWKKGIVVVVSGGNGGGNATRLSNPAQDPFVIAVGASDSNRTVAVSDDKVADFSSRGNATRHADFVAPGVSVLGLRNPGGSVDLANPGARVGTRFFRGSGTSQSAAVVSGAVALLLQRYPTMKPDQVKRQLMNTASTFSSGNSESRGAGVINVRKAQTTSAATVLSVTTTWGTGTGTLEDSRGSYHLVNGDQVLDGERDIFGAAFDSQAWSTASANGNAWSGGTWNGNAWSGNAWTSDDWTGHAWSGNAWSGNAWSDASWAGHAWTGNAWSGNAWSRSAWAGNAWTGNAWTGTPWMSSSWR